MKKKTSKKATKKVSKKISKLMSEWAKKGHKTRTILRDKYGRFATKKKATKKRS